VGVNVIYNIKSLFFGKAVEKVELSLLVERLIGSKLEGVLAHLLTRVQQIRSNRDTLLQEIQHIVHTQVSLAKQDPCITTKGPAKIKI
jgi:hypothetical protein